MNKSFMLLNFLAFLFTHQVSFAAQSLSYPADCKNKTLEAAAKKNGCALTDGGKHWRVDKADGSNVTFIPYSVKENDTCRSIIKAINTSC